LALFPRQSGDGVPEVGDVRLNEFNGFAVKARKLNGIVAFQGGHAGILAGIPAGLQS
jgi:hypothetical protein